MSVQDSRFSIANAVNSANIAFTVNRDEDGKRTDSIFKDALKVTTRLPVMTTLALIASIKTVVDAAFTALTSVLYPVTNRPVKYFANLFGNDRQVTVEALKGAIGYAAVANKEEPKKAPEVKKPVKEEKPSALNNIKEKAVNLGKLAYQHKYKVTMGAIALYFIGEPALRALYNGSEAGISTFVNGTRANFASASNTAVNSAVAAKDGIVWGASSIKNGAVYATDFAVNTTVAAKQKVFG